MENAPNVQEIRLQINLEQAVYALYLDIYSTQLHSNVWNAQIIHTVQMMIQNASAMLAINTMETFAHQNVD